MRDAVTSLTAGVRLMPHLTDLSTVSRYAHVATEELHAAAEKLGERVAVKQGESVRSAA